jgi:uncharacterized protein YjdB
MMHGKLFRNALAVLLATLMMFVCMPVGYADDTAVVTASGNEHLYDALKAKFNFDNDNDGNIMLSEMETLPETLDLSSCSLDNLAGLSYASHVKTLYLIDNPGLTNTPVDDLASVGAMTGLTQLCLKGCTGLKNINALLSLTNLEYLYLNLCTGLTDLPADMSAMTSLWYVSLCGEQYAGVTTQLKISEWPHLSDAILSLPKFKTLTYLTPALLSISCTDVTDVSFLSDAKGMTTLYWQNNADLTAAQAKSLKDLPQLKNLDLANDVLLGNDVLSDTIAPYLTNIVVLGLHNCGITDISSLAGLTGIVTLSLGSNSGITDISVINNFPALSSIRLTNDNKISDFSPLKDHADMYDLDLYGTNFTDNDMKNVSGLHNLGYLDISLNKITSIAALSGLNKLNSLRFVYNFISDLSPISGLKNCTVDITDNALNTSEGADYGIIHTLKSQGCTVIDLVQKKFKVNFAIDGAKGTLTGAASQTGIYCGQTITYPTVTPKSGYVLMGWDKYEGDGTGTLDILNTNGTEIFTTKFPLPDTAYDSGTDSYIVTHTGVFAKQVGISCKKTNVKLYGTAGGSITITASGGSGKPYRYSINGGETTQASGVFAHVAAGKYTCVVWDSACKNNFATQSVTVTQPKFAGKYKASKTPSKAAAGTAITILPAAAPKGYTFKSAVYASSKSAIAAVDQKGNVTFLKGGKVKLTVTMKFQKTVNGKVTTKTMIIKKTVTVKELVSSIKLNKTALSLKVKKTFKLIPTVGASTATSKKVKWKSSNTSVATVSSSGVVKAKKAGKVIITCTAKDGSNISGSCTVTVTN